MASRNHSKLMDRKGKNRQPHCPMGRLKLAINAEIGSMVRLLPGGMSHAWKRRPTGPVGRRSAMPRSCRNSLTQRRLDGRHRIAAIEGGDAVQPRRERIRIGLQPGGGGGLWIGVVVEDRAHDL